MRAMRAYITQRDKWTQIRIGACALLLPPLILGAAFYSMLATTDDSASRPPSAAAGAQVVGPCATPKRLPSARTSDLYLRQPSRLRARAIPRLPILFQFRRPVRASNPDPPKKWRVCWTQFRSQSPSCGPQG